MNRCSVAAVASAVTAIRQRPKPLGDATSTATQTSAFLPLARPPARPGSCPPMNVSSTSTTPDSRSRPGRCCTGCARCSIAHAVWYEPISKVRCRLSAEIPSLAVANAQHALNHTVNGVRVRPKIVPAVTDVRCEQPAHIHRPSPRRQPPACPHCEHTNPCLLYTSDAADEEDSVELA